MNWKRIFKKHEFILRENYTTVVSISLFESKNYSLGICIYY